MRTIQVDDYVSDFLDEAAREYRDLVSKDKAKAFHISVVLSQDIVRRLGPIVCESTMADITRDPESLFTFAADYLRAKRGEKGYSLILGKDAGAAAFPADEKPDAAKEAKADYAAQPKKIKRIVTPSEAADWAEMAERNKLAKLQCDLELQGKRLADVRQKTKKRRKKK